MSFGQHLSVAVAVIKPYECPIQLKTYHLKILICKLKNIALIDFTEFFLRLWNLDVPLSAASYSAHTEDAQVNH